MKKILSTLTVLILITAVFTSSSGQVNINKLKNKVKSKTEVTNKEEQTTNEKEAPTGGKTIYVSKKGSNKNDGSKESPMKNIDKAIAKALAGDKIMIAGGTYMGTFNCGYIETDKPVKLYGSWDESFSKQDIINNPTLFQPDRASASKGRKALLKFKKDVAGTVIDHIVWDRGNQNYYSPKEGFIDGLEGGRLMMPTEPPSDGTGSTVGEPLISFASATTGGDVTITNCVFLNGGMFAVQAGHRSGTFTIKNNVFVSNRMAAVEIYGTCAGSNQKNNMVECGKVEVAYNTILFTWSRLKDFLDMGYGVRIMTKCSYNIHHNIIGANIMGGVDNSRFCKDEYVDMNHNIMFGNKGGDLEYYPASNVELKLTVDQFEDLEFNSVEGNIGKAPEIPVNLAYLKGFYNARYDEVTSYNPNSAQNQWARALGMNQQGTMKSSVSMFMSKYPWKEALSLFGGIADYGAQKP